MLLREQAPDLLSMMEVCVLPVARKFARRSRLGLRYAGLLLRALLTVVAFRALLFVAPYRRIATRIRVRRLGAGEGMNPLLVAWAVSHTARLVPLANCLPQALATQYLLARSGVVVTVRIGVAQHACSEVEAHAWVLHGDTIILGGTPEGLRRYAVLTDLRPIEE